MRSPSNAQQPENEPYAAVMGATWWCPTDRHEDLIVESLWIDPEDWARLVRLRSKPADPVLVSTLPEHITGHDHQDRRGGHDQDCARLEEAVRSYHNLHGPRSRTANRLRYDLEDDGLLVADGRVWPLALLTTTSAEADDLLDVLDDQPAIVRIDTWEDEAQDRDGEEPLTCVQFVLPFTADARDRVDDLLTRALNGAPPKGRPTHYAVQSNPKGSRVFALTPALHGHVSLRALLTAREEDDAFTIARLLNRTLRDDAYADRALDEAERLLSQSSAIAVHGEIDRLRQSR